MKNLSVAKKLFLLFCFSFVLRFAFSVFYWVDKPVTHDAQEYLLLANNLVDGKGYGYEIKEGDKVEHHERAPIYPLFLTAIISIFGDNYTAIKIIQSLIGAILPLIVYGIAAILYKEKTAWLAAFITALYPPLIWGTAEFLSECLFTTIGIYGFFLLIKYSKTDSYRDLISAAFVLLIAAHIKPVILMSLPFVALWIFLRKRTKIIQALAHTIIFGIVAFLLLIPWTIRNYIVQEKFILIASEGGITFWTGNNALAVGDGDMAANPQIKNANNLLRKQNGYPEPAKMEQIYYKEAFTFIKEQPISFITLLIKKSFYFWLPIGRSMSLFSIKHQIISHVSYFPILLLAILGLIKLLKSRKIPVIPLISMFSAMLSCVIFFPQERYRIPMTDPFLIILASYYLVIKWLSFKNEKTKENK